LLLVHGRYSLLRNTKVIYHSFYKNAVIFLIIAWYSFFNGASGLALYGDWIMTFYNLIVTALPPLFVACFDRDISERIINENPNCLKEVQRGIFFNKKTIFSWLASAVWHSIVVFLIGVAIFWKNNNIVMGGRDGDLKLMQNILQTAAVCIPISKFSLEYITWNFVIFIGIWLSIAGYFFILGIECTMLYAIPSQYHVINWMFRTPPFYFMIFLSLVIALFPDFLLKYWVRTFSPANWQILQEIDLKRANRYQFNKDEPIGIDVDSKGSVQKVQIEG